MIPKNPHWIPLLITLLYFGVAFFFPIHADFLTGLVRILLLCVAAFCTLLLWVSYFVWATRGSRKIAVLLLIAFLLPVVTCVVRAGILSYRSRRTEALYSKVRSESSLITMDDEEFVTERGNPVGIRVRYQVRYPSGAETVIPHLPPASLSSAPFPYLQGFSMRNSEYHAINATDYVHTVDLIPGFMPQMVQFPGSPGYPGTVGKDVCFNWPDHASQRTTTLNTPPRTFQVFLSEPAYSAETHRSYGLRRFYDGAIKEGAKECP
jgi:hypothetical protein